ncbi:hypothetical protein BDZ89DRAFT_179178 [Hymenopellis radicata]|nr:hypothetical protein BDZ89DRAFT_179178 [Hymenopellis radicata]
MSIACFSTYVSSSCMNLHPAATPTCRTFTLNLGPFFLPLLLLSCLSQSASESGASSSCSPRRPPGYRVIASNCSARRESNCGTSRMRCDAPTLRLPVLSARSWRPRLRRLLSMLMIPRPPSRPGLGGLFESGPTLRSWHCRCSQV